MVEASKTLKQAWSLNPKSYRVPNMMLVVITSLGGGRDEMEVWFRRAMELKDNNVLACLGKMNYLDPKWHGSREEMMEFGKACRATKNWRGGITVIAASVHIRWAFQLDAMEATAYLQSPGVWEDGKSIYEEYLSHHTKDVAIRSEYAGFTYFCGRRDEAAKQFNILGDKIVGCWSYPLEQMKQFKASLDDEAKSREQREAEAAKRAKPKTAASSPK
jgi:hypothetical protein